MNTLPSFGSLSRPPECIDIERAAEQLNISKAALRNWVKSGFLSVLKPQNAGYFFYKKDIEDIKIKLLSGDLKKLNKRANKIQSHKTFIPKEYLNNHLDYKHLHSLVSFIKTHQIDISAALFFVSLNILRKQKMIASVNLKNIKENTMRFSNLFVKKEIDAWRLELKEKHFKKHYTVLLSKGLPGSIDCLGALHQSLLLEGAKSYSGAYYTPYSIIDGMIKDYVQPNAKVLDPCCGTGSFLLAFADRGVKPSNIYGLDSSKTAVRIAKINLLIKCKTAQFKPHVLHANSLLDFDSYNLFNTKRFDAPPLKEFDFIAANPPWGARFSKTEVKTLKYIHPAINSGESFSYFLDQSLSWLKEGGCLSFLFPSSILNVKAHKDIRQILLNKTRIINITHLGRVFQNVFTPGIRIDLKKENRPAARLSSLTRVQFNDKKYHIPQTDWLKSSNFIFDIYAAPYDRRILKKIYKIKHTSLKNKAYWALGVVTGSNNRFISSSKKPNLEPVYRGKDIKPFVLGEPSGYIDFQPESLQQTAPLFKYRAKKKLIYKFISKQLVFAYDNKQRITLNSANCVIPFLDHYPIKVILGLFNSSLYQFIFQKKFSSIKVLRSHIEELPLPLWDQKILKLLSAQTNRLIQGSKNFKQLDDFILSQFAFSQKEKDYILVSVKWKP